MTLRRRFWVYVLGLIVGSFALYTAALFWTQRGFLEKEQGRVNREELDRWRLLCEQSLLSKDEITLIHYLRELRRADDVVWASFLSLDGRVRIHTTLGQKNSIAEDSVSSWALGIERPAEKRFSEPDGTRAVCAAPVRLKGERVGAALLAFDADRQSGRVRDALGKSLRRFAGVTILCLLAGIGAATGVARSLAEPLQTLTESVRRLGPAGWNARVPSASRRDEIGELARAFEEMARRLGRLDEMKDEFVATVSHDLRNPLGAISMATRYLMSSPPPLSESVVRPVLTTVLLSVARLRGMIDNILDAATIKEGRLTSLKEPFSLGHVMAELHELHRPQADEFGRNFRLEIPADLPEVRGDENQAYRVLSNLLTNAFKFTSAGDRIILSAGAVGSDVIAEVRDSGPGIPAQDLPGLFRRFQTGESAHSVVRKKQGTGLGLAIAKSLAEAQGGSLTVESREGGGTVFRFCLPQAGPT